MSAIVTTLPGSTFDGMSGNTYRRDVVIIETATAYVYVTEGGHRITLIGNFTYPDGPGTDPSGAIMEMRLDQDNNGTTDMTMTFTGSLPMAQSLFLSSSSIFRFWNELFDGDDTLTISSNIASNSYFAADGGSEVFLNAAGDDTIIFTGSGRIIGDARSSSSGQGSVIGGTDDLTVNTLLDAIIIGDFQSVSGSTDFVAHNNTGGNDVITDNSAAGGAVHRIFGDYESAPTNSSLIELGEINGGDDTISGTEAALIVVGDIDAVGGDNFTITGGSDDITGGSANDEFYGDVRTVFSNFSFEGNNNTITGGVDDISGGAGDDLIVGDVGELGDANVFTGGNDILNGDAGNDTIYGDYITNGSSLIISGGNDTINGGAGNDILYGQEGNDDLDGGDDNDTFFGGAGNDTLDGGLGIDTASWVGSVTAVNVVIAGTSVSSSGTATGEGTDTLISIENLIGSAFDDTILGDVLANVIEGGDGDDFLNGRGGEDLMRARAAVLRSTLERLRRKIQWAQGLIR